MINLCGKKIVRNCDLLQSDFFARCRTVLEVAKGFFCVCGETWKKMKPRNVVIFTLGKHAFKSHLPKLITRAGRSDISGPEKVVGHPNGALYFHESQEHAIFSILHNL